MDSPLRASFCIRYESKSPTLLYRPLDGSEYIQIITFEVALYSSVGFGLSPLRPVDVAFVPCAASFFLCSQSVFKFDLITETVDAAAKLSTLPRKK